MTQIFLKLYAITLKKSGVSARGIYFILKNDLGFKIYYTKEGRATEQSRLAIDVSGTFTDVFVFNEETGEQYREAMHHSCHGEKRSLTYW
ncbi:hypothetical protein [Lysinibacillus sp. NPDC092081]|uniref:hypothetical protein n=1 Tax=Lysinibacillus sp. NPDC092081 TaxID=3364131 RepID=UPI003822E092